MANSWLLNRLREIHEQSKSWPAWVFEQPLTSRDAEKIARGEKLRSPVAMANDDVIERAERLLLEPIVNRMAAGERACQLVIDLVVELRASRARVAELEQDARRLDHVLRNLNTALGRATYYTMKVTRETIDAAMAGEADS